MTKLTGLALESAVTYVLIETLEERYGDYVNLDTKLGDKELGYDESSILKLYAELERRLANLPTPIIVEIDRTLAFAPIDIVRKLKWRIIKQIDLQRSQSGSN